MTSIEDKIAEHEREIQTLRDEQARLMALSPERRLAEALHELQCRWNHTDGCGWFYEIDKGVVNWQGHAHASYLKKAVTVIGLLPTFTPDEIIEVATALKG